MLSLKVVLFALCTVLLYATLVSNAKADEWNKRTLVKFSEPVEVEGKVLPAGTYIFQLMDDPSDRNIVQIWKEGENGNQFVTTILAIPCTRTGPNNRAVFELGERPSGSPMAIKEWFYVGDSTGQEFPD